MKVEVCHNVKKLSFCHSDDRREEKSRWHKGCFRDPSLRAG